MSENDSPQLKTSDLTPPPHTMDLTDGMLNEILLTLKLERAVIFVKSDLGWQVSSAHEIPTDNFWNTAPISLKVVDDATRGETVHLIDAGDSDYASRASVVITGIRSVACVPVKTPSGEVGALLYADNRIAKGAFSEEDIKTLSELATELGNRLFSS